MKNVKKKLGIKLIMQKTNMMLLKDADALIIATEWNEFSTPDFEKMVSLLKNKVIFDGRNRFDFEA